MRRLSQNDFSYSPDDNIAQHCIFNFHGAVLVIVLRKKEVLTIKYFKMNRFASLDEENIQAILKEKDAINTQKAA